MASKFNDYDDTQSQSRTLETRRGLERLLVQIRSPRYNLTTGVFIGKQEGAGTLVLGESGDEFTTDGSTALFDANGNPTGTSCSNSVGTRFKLEQ